MNALVMLAEANAEGAVQQIARTFGVGIDDVFTYEEDKDGPSNDE